jgi:bifunctional non-homologous end joining protein LigD
MPLEEYRKKRHFEKTPEPAGKKKGAGKTPAAGLFVIQKHAARQLHYDLRLELAGVLVSWAVPKGPSLDPAQKRLAVHVEDHPLEYGDFEGSIPAGEYGGGTVLLWDRGTWEPALETAEDPAAGMAKGTLKVILHGEKLNGLWTLVRMKPRGNEPPDKSWLLFKDRDEWARPIADGDVLAESPGSVATGRTIEEVAADPEAAVFSSDEKRLVRGEMAGKPGGGSAPDPAVIPGARKAKMPDWIEPQLALLVGEAPVGGEWIHEVKFDGYRMQCHVSAGANAGRGGRRGEAARLLSRNNVDWTDRFSPIAKACAGLPVKQAILDGEVVFARPDGTTSFGDLREAISAKDTAKLVFYVFDILYLDGYDLRGATLAERKRALFSVLGPASGDGLVRYADHVEGSGEAFYREACRMALEGVVSKRADSPYRAGRGREWLKVKCLTRQEFVVVGYTEPSGSRKGFGALVLGYRDKDGRLVYSGRVGTGFSERTLAELSARLKKLERKTSPLAEELPRMAARGVHWVRPALVAEVSFIEWTGYGHLRHPSFLGLREDKAAEEVVRETPAAKSDPPGKNDDPVVVAGIKLTHPDKILYPEQGLTKTQLARYYESIEEWVLPHLVGRPLSLVRCPEGHEGGCFYQKHVEAAYPKAVRRMIIEDSNGPSTYAYVSDIGGVVALVQMGVLEIHTWGSRTDDVERPDHVVFDLDPAEGLGFDLVIEAAEVIRDGLDALGLASFVKTTGGKGLHVVSPIRRGPSWTDVRDFTQAFARQVAGAAPDRYTSNPLKARRVGKVFVDYVRNTRGATAVAPYSTRARPGTPVSVPVTWDELRRGVDPKAFTVASVPKRLAALRKDPWDGYSSLRQGITARARKALGL